jgi:hypothetical protein
MSKTLPFSSFAREVRDEDQVAGRGDRQELGEPLDHSKA